MRVNVEDFDHGRLALQLRVSENLDESSTAKNSVSFCNLLELRAYNKQGQGKFSSTSKCGAQPGSRSLTVVLRWVAIMSWTAAEGDGRGGGVVGQSGLTQGKREGNRKLHWYKQTKPQFKRGLGPNIDISWIKKISKQWLKWKHTSNLFMSTLILKQFYFQKMSNLFSKFPPYFHNCNFIPKTSTLITKFPFKRETQFFFLSSCAPNYLSCMDATHTWTLY